MRMVESQNHVDALSIGRQGEINAFYDKEIARSIGCADKCPAGQPPFKNAARSECNISEIRFTIQFPPCPTGRIPAHDCSHMGANQSPAEIGQILIDDVNETDMGQQMPRQLQRVQVGARRKTATGAQTIPECHALPDQVAFDFK